MSAILLALKIAKVFQKKLHSYLFELEGGAIVKKFFNFFALTLV
jgi:hypothetical protein